MEIPRPARLDRLDFARTAVIGGAGAGLVGGAATLLLLAQRALLQGITPGMGFAQRALWLDSEAAAAGAALQLLACTAVGALFGLHTGVRSGLEVGLRGLLLGVLLWAVGWLALPLLAPDLWRGPLEPILAEYLLYGLLLGLQAPLCRRMLQLRWRRAAARQLASRSASAASRHASHPT